MSASNRPDTTLPNAATPAVGPSNHVEVASRVLLVVAIACLFITAVPATVATEEPTAAAARADTQLVVRDATVAHGESESVAIVLTDAPNGLAGFEITLATDGSGSLRGGSYPDAFEMTTDPTVEDGNRTITLEAADLRDDVSPGATDVTIATVDVRGVAPGETTVRVTSAHIDADDGRPIEAAPVNGTVAVQGGAAGDGDTTDGRSGTGDAVDGQSDAGDTLAGFGPIVALAAVCCVVLRSMRR